MNKIHCTSLAIFALSLAAIITFNINNVIGEIKSTSTIEDDYSNDTQLSLIPQIINITKNTNAINTAQEYIINIFNDTKTDSNLVNQTAFDKIPILIETLKNTNATSIAIQYVINITNSSILK